MSIYTCRIESERKSNHFMSDIEKLDEDSL